MKKCDKCKKLKAATSFWKDKYAKDKRQHTCIECWKPINDAKNPRHNARKSGIKFIEPNHDVLLFNFQNGKCAVCGMIEGKRRHHRDHNHKTGWLRGYLCGNCNHFLPSAYTDKSLVDAEIYFRSRQMKEQLITMFMNYLKNPPYWQLLDSLGTVRPTGTWAEWSRR